MGRPLKGRPFHVVGDSDALLVMGAAYTNYWTNGPEKSWAQIQAERAQAAVAADPRCTAIAKSGNRCGAFGTPLCVGHQAALDAGKEITYA